MQQSRFASATDDLFNNTEPETVWRKATDIIKMISPGFNFSFSRMVFDDVIHLFLGKYPGFHPIKTPYHDQSHTLDVFLCAVRLMHGMHASGTSLNDQELNMVLIATLMHDVGYAQKRSGKTNGTGAQFTKTHILRGIEFLQDYLDSHKHPAGITRAKLAPIINCSDPMLPLANIAFQNDRLRLLGQILGTADLVGQMADRNYLEKLTSLYEEFQEAQLGNYRNIYDLMCKTHHFWGIIKKKLDDDFGGMYAHLTSHFNATMNMNKNFYMDSIVKNMEYLKQVVAMGETDYLSMLKRGGFAGKLVSGSIRN